ncbi:MAG: FKBP-type peptidyl-prolyl cis-trans isomerase [Rikenellaceae bacterium]
MRDMLKYMVRYAVVVIFAVAALCSCEEGDDDNYDQMEDIVSFLESSHSPKLIAESEVASALDDNPPFYSIWGVYSFRYISTFYDAGRSERSEIVSGSVVTLSFDLYEFDGSAIDETTDLPAYSNRASDEARLVEAGLNTQLWDFTPITLTIGSGTLFAAIEENLKGCREGDEIYIYMTYNDAYGDDVMGLISKNAMVRFSCTVESVE